VEVTGFVGHDEAMRRLAACSALVLAGPRDARGILRGQVAGKVWEYLATPRPIVYVGDLDCDVADVLRGEDACHLCAPGDEAAALAGLERSRGILPARDASRFSRRARARELAAILDRVTGASR
jgi:hypothetical protein